MSYIAEVINRECPECQGDRVATILARNGVTNYILDYHYEIFQYFKDRLEHHSNTIKPLRNATYDTLVKYDISRFQLIRIRKQF
jgi:hypothetical protein